MSTYEPIEPAQVGSTGYAPSGATPGWYPDPSGAPNSRYWDGTQWTQNAPAFGPGYTSVPSYPPHVAYPGYPIAPNISAPVVCGLAIASMVLGILWLYWVGSLLAIIFAFIALKQIKDAHGAKTGKGMAIAGMVLGWVGVGTFLIFFMFGVLTAANHSTGPCNNDPTSPLPAC
jgi:hypothetical protein